MQSHRGIMLAALVWLAIGQSNYGSYQSEASQEIDTTKTISWLGPEENVSIPSTWTSGRQAYGSINGGMNLRLLVNGFTESVINRAKSVMFIPTRNNKDTMIYIYPISKPRPLSPQARTTARSPAAAPLSSSSCSRTSRWCDRPASTARRSGTSNTK